MRQDNVNEKMLTSEINLKHHAAWNMVEVYMGPCVLRWGA